MKTNSVVTVIIPTYNEELGIGPTLNELRKFLEDPDLNIFFPGEYIVEKRNEPEIGKTTLTCVFTYKITAKPLITLTDSSKTSPVWNGTNVSLEPLKANFSLKLESEPKALLEIEDLVGEYTLELNVIEPPEIGRRIYTLTIDQDGDMTFWVGESPVSSTVRLNIVGTRFSAQWFRTSIEEGEATAQISLENGEKVDSKLSGIVSGTYKIKDDIKGNFLATK